MEVELRFRRDKHSPEFFITIQGEEDEVGRVSAELCAKYLLVEVNTRPRHIRKEAIGNDCNL